MGSDYSPGPLPDFGIACGRRRFSQGVEGRLADGLQFLARGLAPGERIIAELPDEAGDPFRLRPAVGPSPDGPGGRGQPDQHTQDRAEPNPSDRSNESVHVKLPKMPNQ